MTVPMPAQLMLDAEAIASIPIGCHFAGQTLGAWSRHPVFSNDSSVQQLIAIYGDNKLSRADLFQLGANARAGTIVSYRRLLAATLIWGNARVGGRGTTAFDPLTDAGPLGTVLHPLGAGTVLTSLYSDMALGGNSHIDQYGESFFTKYLYFLHANNPLVTPASPLIFDSRVKDTLAGNRLTFCNTCLTNSGWRWTPRRKGGVAHYVEYCETVKVWSAKLTATGTQVTPDQIERYIFGR